ncbi:MAG: hypothetical protein AAB614_00965 [Patescibacteria group bacterium]
MGTFERIFKPISTLLVAILIVNSFLFAILYSPNPARAILGAGDIVSDPIQTALTTVWKAIKTAFDAAKAAADKIWQASVTFFNTWEKSENIMAQVSYALLYATIELMLAKMTTDIVNWINGGAKGSPKVALDFEEIFEDSLDQAAGSVIGDILGLPNGELCDPNFLKVNLPISLDTIQAPTFQEKLKCSFSEIGTNIKDFEKDFSKGGWIGWIRYGKGANNQIGAMMIAKDELAKRAEKAEKAAELKITTGDGFLPQEDCVVTRDINKEIEASFASSGDGDIVGGIAEFGGRSLIGKKLKNILSAYGYSNEDDFKSFWNSSGGAFTCKIKTPAKIIADITSQTITAPLKKLNDQMQAAASELGSKAPAILRPYLNAISTAAINLIIKKEQGIISGVIRQNKPRTNKRQNTDAFRDSSNTLFASESLSSSATDLRSLLMRTTLDFSLFAGVLKEVVENKNILFESPILVSELIHSGYIWSSGFGYGAKASVIWLPNPPYSDNPTSVNDPSMDELISTRTKEVIDKKTAIGYPTLPIAGTINLAGKTCGAFTQEITPTVTTTSNETISPRIGYVSLVSITNADGSISPAGSIIYNNTVSGNTGFFNGPLGQTRIIAFNDKGFINPDSLPIPTPIPDRFVRQIVSPSNPNDLLSNTVTFIDVGGFNSIVVGTPLNTTDPNYDTTILYTSELFSVGSTDLRVSTSGAGDIYYITGNKNPGNLISSGNITYTSVGITSDYNYRYAVQLGNGTSGSGQFVRLPEYSSLSLAITPAYTDPDTFAYIPAIYTDPATEVLFKDIFVGGTINYSNTANGQASYINCRNDNGWYINLSTCRYWDGGTSNEVPAEVIPPLYTGGNCTWIDSDFAELSQVQCEKNIPILGYSSQPDLNLIGIPAYRSDENYNLKYFSPSFPGATTSIENKRLIVRYDDILIDPSQPASDTNPPTTLKDGEDKVTINNSNPFKMTLLDFFPEVDELQNEFMVKIRVLLGYTQRTKKKTHFSSLADQIGAIPDDGNISVLESSPGINLPYISVSDVLTKYNNLSKLYQELFLGVSNEDSLEGLDPLFNTLNATEINIKRALIGQRCPTIPPTLLSSQNLIDGCGRFGATTINPTTTGEYNMAKKFIFERERVEAPNSGFATNPFNGTNSNVIAGVLNLDEMTQQLATLAPDKNIIKLIRLRQILEQLQINSQPITFYGETTSKDKVITPTILSGVDTIQLSLRNYPEIENFLNDITTDNKPITDLITAYAFAVTNTKEAYPVISDDLDNILPDITTQIQDQLKEVFLKRVELELEQAKKEAQIRLLDFIYFAEDLSPAVQVEVPKGFINSSDAIIMGLDALASRIIRVGTSTFNTQMGMTLSTPLAPGVENNCLSLSGDKILAIAPSTNCSENPEFKLRGMKVLPWNLFSADPDMTIIQTNTPTSQEMEKALKAVGIRKALMAGIREKMKHFGRAIGVNVDSVEFEAFLSQYVLPLTKKGDILPDGTTDLTGGKIPINDWDGRIARGLADVDIMFTGIYSTKINHLNNPGIILSNGESIYTDIQTKMTDISNNFSLLQVEFEKIKEIYTSSGSSSIASSKASLEEMIKLLKTMDDAFSEALACTDTALRINSNANQLQLALATGGLSILTDGLGIAFGGPVGLATGMIIGAWLTSRAKKKAKKKARQIADTCASKATDFNNAAIELVDNFICGK